MDKNLEALEEKKYLAAQLNIQSNLGCPPAERVGKFAYKGLPDDGWKVVHSLADTGMTPNCDRCGYPNLTNAVLVEHPSGTQQVVGLHCAREVTRDPVVIR